MMASSLRVAAFVAWFTSPPDEERQEIQSTAEFCYLRARLQFRPDYPVPVECIDLAIKLEVRYPHSLEYYRERAEDPRRRLLTERRPASVPFSAGRAGDFLLSVTRLRVVHARRSQCVPRPKFITSNRSNSGLSLTRECGSTCAPRTPTV